MRRCCLASADVGFKQIYDLEYDVAMATFSSLAARYPGHPGPPLGAAAVLSTRGRDRGVEVRMEEVGTRDLVATVTASGNVRARRKVDISSDVQGRVVELNVEEGDEVSEGAVLLRIDPTQYQAQRARNEGALHQQYQLGFTSFVELVEAETVKAQADRELISAVFSYHDNLARLEAVVGTSLRP